MIVPGSNLLNLALTVIGSQALAWYRATGRTPNALGEFITTYADPVVIYGSLQPIDKAKYEDMGLDLAKTYYAFYTSNGIEGVRRDDSPDWLRWNNRRLEVVDEADWLIQDGWRGLVLVDEGPAPEIPPQ
jgi:hypothetical protein